MSGAPHTPDSLRAITHRVLGAGEALRALPADALVQGLARAASVFGQDGTMLAREAHAMLPGSAGLSPEMVRWALRASLSRVTDSALHRLMHTPAAPIPGAAPARARLAVVVLAANVFTACVEPVLFALLARVPVVLKASSRDDVFPRLFALALRDAHPVLGDAVEVVTFPGGDTALEDALFADADVVSVYGHDATLAAIRGRLSPTTTFVPHGTGMGAIHIGRGALTDDDAVSRIALAVAEDVAAYDQRGCLSPHVAFVEPDGAMSPRDFADMLSNWAFPKVAKTLPRGPLPVHDAAAQMQWRGVAITRGELFEGSMHAVSYEQEGPLRLSPGYRNLSVITVRNLDDVVTRMAPMGVHWKALGTTLPAAEWIHHLPPPLCPRLSAVGAMQTPALDALADGASRWDGLIRWIA